ncbi:unnamed protein product [Allacma fusca]|uniref:Uncharacterized protein n=1 Tax=Allacma fusca TaxID=39272 RepID=A0A8J2JKL3_9HEXA|nr:unnamed protein product [Allacma fusca]
MRGMSKMTCGLIHHQKCSDFLGDCKLCELLGFWIILNVQPFTTMNKDVVERWIQGTMEASKENNSSKHFGGDETWLEPNGNSNQEDNNPRTITDPYAGLLMSESNKTTIRNIQLRQLARDHPHTRDFYNLTVEIRKANQQSNQGEVTKLMGKLYPLYRLDDGLDEFQRQGPFSEETLSKCLGSLKINTGAGPKTILDPELCDRLKQMAPSKPNPGPGKVNLNSAQLRYVFMQIELLYRYLLDYEEAEARISLLRYRSDYDLNLKNESLLCAKEIVLNKRLLRNMLTVDKGKMVVCRLLPAFHPAVAIKVLSSFVDLIPEWKFDTSQKAHKIYTCFSYCICEANESNFKAVLEAGTEDVIRQLTSTELGMSFLTLVLNQGQELYNKTQDKLGYFAILWTNFFNIISNIIGSLENLCVPYEVFPAFTENLKRGNNFTSEDIRELWFGLEKIFCDNGAIISSDA